MSNLINLNEGIQDIIITEDEGKIFFAMKRANNNELLYEVNKKDVINDHEFQDNLRRTSNLDNYYDKQQANEILISSSNLKNYYNKNQMDFVLKYTSSLANYYTKFETNIELDERFYNKSDTDQLITGASNLENYFTKESVTGVIKSFSNLDEYDSSVVVTEKAIDIANQFNLAFVYSSFQTAQVEKLRAFDLVQESFYENERGDALVTSIVASKDGKVIYVAYLGEIDKVDTKTMTRIETYDMGLNQRTSLHISIDAIGEFLYVCTSTQFVMHKIDTRTMTKVNEFGDGLGSAGGMCISPDREHLYLSYTFAFDNPLFSEQNALVKISTLEMSEVASYYDTDRNETIRTIHLTGDGSSIFVGTLSGILISIDTISMKQRFEYIYIGDDDARGSITSIATSLYDSRNGFMFLGYQNGTLSKVILDEQGKVNEQSEQFVELNDSPIQGSVISGIKMSPDKSFLYVSSLNHFIYKLRSLDLTVLDRSELSITERTHIDVGYEEYGGLMDNIRFDPNLQESIRVNELQTTEGEGGLVFLQTKTMGDKEGVMVSAYIHEDGVFVGGKLHVNQDFPKYNVDINGDMRCTGPCFLEDSVKVSGPCEFNKYAHFYDSVQIDDDLSVTQSLNVGSNLEVGVKLIVHDDATCHGGLTVRDVVTINSNVNVDGDINVVNGDIIGYDRSTVVDSKIRTSSNMEFYYTKIEVDDIDESVKKRLGDYALTKDIPPFFHTIPGRLNLIYPTYTQRIGIQIFPPEASLHINDDLMILGKSKTIDSLSENGKKGSICWDSEHLYVCTEDANWKKSSLTEVGSEAIQLNDSSTPSDTPSNAGYLFSEDGALKWKGSSGTITTVAPA